MYIIQFPGAISVSPRDTDSSVGENTTSAQSKTYRSDEQHTSEDKYNLNMTPEYRGDRGGTERAMGRIPVAPPPKTDFPKSEFESKRVPTRE